MPVGCSTQRQSPEGPNSLLDPDSTPPERLQPKDPGLPAQGDRDTEPTARRRSFGRPVYIVTTACGGGGLASDVQATGRGASDAGTREEMESRKRRRMPDGTVRLPKSRAYILLVAVVFNLTWGLVKPWLKGSTFLLRKDVKKCIREVGGGVQNPAAACRARRADCQRVSEREKCGGSKLTWHGLPSLTAAPQTVADAHHAPHTHLRGFLWAARDLENGLGSAQVTGGSVFAFGFPSPVGPSFSSSTRPGKRLSSSAVSTSRQTRADTGGVRRLPQASVGSPPRIDPCGP